MKASPTCKICNSTLKNELEELYSKSNNLKQVQKVARDKGLSVSYPSTLNHFRKHFPKKDTPMEPSFGDFEIISVVNQANTFLWRKITELEKIDEASNWIVGTQARLITSIHKGAELKAKILGLYNEDGKYNYLLSRQFQDFVLLTLNNADPKLKEQFLKEMQDNERFLPK